MSTIVTLDRYRFLIENSQVYVNRDFLDTLSAHSSLEVVLLWGPRQSGKTTLLDRLPLKSRFFLDDLAVRETAQNDPALFFAGAEYPCLIDEAQYAPNLFPEIKFQVDQLRREQLKTKSKKTKRKPLFYLTGSNRLMLDQSVKESLAGRSHLFTLHGLSVKEILSAFSHTTIQSMLFKGGYPELYTQDINPKFYLNDYILSFVEKDIARSSGVEKINEFHTVLRLLAARSGKYLNVSEIATQAGVEQDTVAAWIEILRRNYILEMVPAFAANISKRVVKMKKLFFYDSGLCARLQGHQDPEALWGSPQVGALFETLVFSELVKTKDNFLKEWQIFSWRTKEKNEIDFVVETPIGLILIEAKLSIHSAKAFTLDPEAKKIFKKIAKKIVVTAGGSVLALDRDTWAVPLQKFGQYLIELGA